MKFITSIFSAISSALLKGMETELDPPKPKKIDPVIIQRNTPKLDPEVEFTFASPVPQEVIDHLKFREGAVYEVYRDSLGYLTAGVGHLLPKDTELEEGSPVSPEQVDQWLAEDAYKAYTSACRKCAMLGIKDQEFCNALTSVNFQLGTNWDSIHKKTWAYLKAKKYSTAATEVFNSKWYQQTPVRVEDFSRAIIDLQHREVRANV